MKKRVCGLPYLKLRKPLEDAPEYPQQIYMISRKVLIYV
jgi:hypothetical protein